MSPYIHGTSSTYINLEDTSLVTIDVIVGICMSSLSFVCGCGSLIIMKKIWRKSELWRMSSYKFMFSLALSDLLQSIAHFNTGIFTIFPTTYIPTLAKAMGVLATPAYVAYAVLTVILAFDRFVQIHCPQYDSVIFSGVRTKLWLSFVACVWLLFAVCLASPRASIIYYPNKYSWSYDDELELSYLVQKCEMVIELSSIILSGVFYSFIVIALYRTRKRFVARSNFRSEAKILIQAFAITLYGVVMNFLWHNPQGVLSSSKWSYMALNMMWILSTGIYPLIFFISNRAMQDSGRKKPRVTTIAHVDAHAFQKYSNDREESHNRGKIVKHFDVEAIVGDLVKNSRKIQCVS